MASRYLVPGGDGNYNSTSNWSATDGGASGSSFPVAADDIIINANSFNTPLNINVLSACKSFIVTNYTGTITMTNNLSVNGTTNTGNITLSAGMIITGNGTFIKVPTGTTGVITSNGAIFDCNFTFSPAGATTTIITGTMQVNKNLTFSLNSTSITTINTGTINLGGDLIHNGPVAGTSTIQLIGSTTSTITQVATRLLQTNLTINKTGILNLINLYFSTRTLTYTSGIVNISDSLIIGNCTLNTNGIIWNNIQTNGVGALILTITSQLNSISFTGNGNAVTFTGSAGFNFDNFILPLSVTANIIFANNLNYYVNNNFTIFGSATGINNPSTIRASSTITNLILGNNCICKIAFVNITNVNASQGKRLYVLCFDNGDTIKTCTITNSSNVFKITKRLRQYNKTI